MSKTTCPVCDWEITDQGVIVQLGEVQLTVCCDDCAKTAMENPSTYAGHVQVPNQGT